MITVAMTAAIKKAAGTDGLGLTRREMTGTMTLFFRPDPAAPQRLGGVRAWNPVRFQGVIARRWPVR